MAWCRTEGDKPLPGPLMTLFTDANMNPKSSNAHAGISCNETMSDQHDVVSGWSTYIYNYNLSLLFNNDFCNAIDYKSACWSDTNIEKL